MPLRISISDGGAIERRLAPAFEAAMARTRDLSPAFQAMGVVFRHMVRTQFRTQGASGSGQEWKPLSEQYLKWKERHCAGNLAILICSGRMHDALTESGHSEHIAEIGSHSAVFGARVPYAHWHQTGGPVAGRPPQRKIIAPNADDVDQLAGILSVYLHPLGGAAALQRAGRRSSVPEIAEAFRAMV